MRPDDIRGFLFICQYPWHVLCLVASTLQLIFSCFFLCSVQFSRSVTSDSATPWTAALQASLSITSSQSPPKPMSIDSVVPSNHLITSVIPFFSGSQSFPALGSFQMSRLFASRGQSTGVSASTSVLPMNTQD